MLLGHALGDGVRELQEPVVELAEVAEDERLHDPVLVDEVGRYSTSIYEKADLTTKVQT